MCIALLIKPEVEIEDTTLRNCYINNSDGCGFAYVNQEEQIVIYKSMNYDEFLSAFKEAREESSDSPFLVHFRIATHGTVDEFNCHPFLVDDNTAFIHNGIISGIRLDKVKSDTQVFNEDILRELPRGWEFNIAIRPLIEKFIGYSKLVVLNSAKEWSIFNENKGEWKDDIWFSNTSYKPRVVYGSYFGNKATTYSKGKEVKVKKKEEVKQLPASTVDTDPYFARDVYDNQSWEIDIKEDYHPCDNCGEYHPIVGMKAYEGLETAKVFCDVCEDSLLDANFIDPKDNFSIALFVEDYNKRLANSTLMGDMTSWN